MTTQESIIPAQLFHQFDATAKRFQKTTLTPYEKIHTARELLIVSNMIVRYGYHEELQRIFDDGVKDTAIVKKYALYGNQTIQRSLLRTKTYLLAIAAEYEQYYRYACDQCKKYSETESVDTHALKKEYLGDIDLQYFLNKMNSHVGNLNKNYFNRLIGSAKRYYKKSLLFREAFSEELA